VVISLLLVAKFKGCRTPILDNLKSIWFPAQRRALSKI